VRPGPSSSWPPSLSSGRLGCGSGPCSCSGSRARRASSSARVNCRPAPLTTRLLRVRSAQARRRGSRRVPWLGSQGNNVELSSLREQLELAEEGSRPDLPCERHANISPSTRGHARATSRRQIPSACCAFVPATTRPYPNFPRARARHARPARRRTRRAGRASTRARRSGSGRPTAVGVQGVLYQGTVRSSPKWGNALVAAKRVMCEICSPSSVSTSSPTARPISACGSFTECPKAG
jgi:hypothetical protein